MKRAIFSVIGSVLAGRAKEPSSYAGAGLAALGVGMLPDDPAPLFSGEFVQALAVVIAGILAIVFSERKKDA